jgi:hypothetical protein
MIIKNHDIELKDTSASEIARFRQIMLSIWRQQIEDDKNSAEMLKYVSTSNIFNGTILVSVTKIIESIKNKIGEIHEHMFFHDLVAIPNSMPDGFENFTYNDSQGNVKEGGILLKWNQFKGINLVPGTFQAFIEIGIEQTDFILTIFNNDLTETAFKFTVHDFDLFMALFKSLGIKYSDTGNKAIIDLYLKNIKEAKNDPNKLDVIYESLPKILFGKMEDADLYKHLDLILNDMYVLGGSVGTNEDKAILQILYAIKDRKSLYMILNDIELLYKIYTRLQGEEMQHLLRFLTRLVGEFDTSKTADTVYFDNSYYLFRDTHVETDWSGGEILINNYKNSTKMGPKVGFKNPMEIPFTENYIANKGFNPLAKLNFGTKLGNLGEQTGDENTFVIALKLHNMATKQSNWDLFNVATDLLSLLSAYGALRVVLAKGAPIVARAIAGVVLAKDATHYAMLSNGTLEKWHENGYGWLAKLWIAFSVTVDLASFGLPNLSKIAKEGNAAAELAETAEDAKEIKKVADEANRIVEAETGKDVSKMNEKQFEKFVEKTIKLEELTKTKAEELIKVFSKIEPQITDDLTNLARKNGGRMEGLDFKLKTFESLNRKLITDGINTPMNDVLRYTIIIDKEITNGVNTILKELKSKGYQIIKIKNTFKEGQIYKGINTNVKSPEGNIFEIQYHTSESFNVKQNINHILYEKYRLLPDDSAEAIDLVSQMMKNSNSVKLPKDINTIK